MGGSSIFYYIIIIALVALDQLLKQIAASKLKYGKYVLTLKSTIRFTIVRNPGAAFGILKGKPRLLMAVTLLLILLLVYYLTSLIIFGGPDMEVYALVLIAGGAIGNFLDRIRLRYVIDYVSLNIGKFPYFNAADLFIFTGSIMYLVYAFTEL